MENIRPTTEFWDPDRFEQLYWGKNPSLSHE